MRIGRLLVLAGGLRNFAQAQSAAQLIAQLPSCAISCISQYLPDTSCSVTDIPCICANTDLWKNVTWCVLPACTVKEALTAQKLAADTCARPIRDRRGEMKITIPVVIATSSLMVLVRIIARKPSVSNMPGWDDVTIIFAWLTALPLAVTQYYLAKHGLGRDIWTLDDDDITEVLKFFFIAEVFYLAATVLTKVSILFFYLRVFPSFSFRWVVWGVLATCLSIFVSFLFALIFQCSPVSYAWTRWDGEHSGHCINIAAGIFSHAAINMVLDLIVLALPLPLLYRLKLTYSNMGKIHIFIMFSFGLVVTIISALRLQTLVAFLGSRNPTYDFFGSALWSVLETFIGIICACLPAAKVFFLRMAPKWMGLSTIGSHHSQRGQTPQPFSKSVGTSSKSSSANRFSKPPQHVSATVSAIPEEGDFLPLQSMETESLHEAGRITALPTHGSAMEVKRDPKWDLTLPIQGFDSDSEKEHSKRGSWVVTGPHGKPLQTFGTASRTRKDWPLT